MLLTYCFSLLHPKKKILYLEYFLAPLNFHQYVDLVTCFQPFGSYSGVAVALKFLAKMIKIFYRFHLSVFFSPETGLRKLLRDSDM